MKGSHNQISSHLNYQPLALNNYLTAPVNIVDDYATDEFE